MKLKLTLRRPTAPADLIVDVDGSTTVGALADVLARSDPAAGSAGEAAVASPTLTVESVAQPGLTLDPALTVADAGIASGQYVTLAAAPRSTGAAAVLTVLAGPDAGRSFELGRGVSTIGRDEGCTVALSDPMVSKDHARIVVADTVEIVDDNSSNGVVLGADRVQRVELRDGDAVLLGDSLISVQRAIAPGSHSVSGAIPFTRSPRLDPQWEGLALTAPEPPTPSKPQRFPVTMLLMPLLMGALFVVILAGQDSSSGAAMWMPVVFIVLSPLMMLGSWAENRRANRRDFAASVAVFEENLAQLSVELRQAHDAERTARSREHPPTADVVEAAQSLSPLLWCRRPDLPSFGHVRLGLGSQPSRTKVELSSARNSPVDLQRRVADSVSHFRTVDNVPVVAALAECGSIGVAGPTETRAGISRALVAQVAGFHSPAELTMVALASPRSSPEWDWIKWLPHVGGEHHPLAANPLAVTAPACSAIVDELAELIEDRRATSNQREAVVLPVVLVLVEDDAPVDRSALVRIMESGPAFGVHVLWMADALDRIPAAARTYVEVDPDGKGAAAGRVIEAQLVSPVVLEQLDRSVAEWFGRRLAPVVDIGASSDAIVDVPTRVSFLSEVGASLADAPASVIDRWVESNSLLVRDRPHATLKRDNTLRSFVGRTRQDPFHLDLRSQGPHALVGGTTGAGKSEFLQTWILGMAVAHSPQRVTFLFVDYKGGAAFADCVNLPHSVGLVTDLSPHLVQRALLSLNAELRHREHILNARKAKDLLELERRGDPDCPPSLVIVVDEFAALVQEVPEFVDGVVNVAQRGRSLGLHLILATQRPAGVIKDNLRANTNLRIALRVADEEDSRDVVGDPIAGTFDPSIPGRAIAKTGPGRLSIFQSAYVGGWTSDVPPPPKVDVSTLAFGPAEIWEVPEAEDAPGDVERQGKPDIQRVVDNVGAAAAELSLAPPRRPWLPELATTYDLAGLPMKRRDSELVLGVADYPDHQQQEVVTYRPDDEGNVAIFGAGGSGKSTLLRTIAAGAGLTRRSGPCFVYALDYAARGLSMLEVLPHVGAVISAEDAERTARLIRRLKDEVDERAVRYAAVNAGSIEEYRRIAEKPDEPRILLLIDGFSAFRSAFEVWPASAVFDTLVAVAAGGRALGIHVVIAADRVNTIPSSLASSIGRRIALRTATDMDDAVLRVPKNAWGSEPIPGRAFLDGVELQVAVFGGSPDVTAQAAALDELAASMRRAQVAAAPPVERLPEEVAFELVAASDLPNEVVPFGLSDEDLAPIGFAPTGTFLVTGPPGSGRTETIRTLIAGLRIRRPGTEIAYLGTRRSPLSQDRWETRAVGPSEVATIAGELATRWKDGELQAPVAVVIDGLGEFVSSEADQPLQALLKVCRANDVLVLVDGESADVQSSWPLVSTVKSSRTGIALQPDQSDGDMVFRTPFPRMARSDWPVGRGMYVRQGRFSKVQVALSSQ